MEIFDPTKALIDSIAAPTGNEQPLTKGALFRAVIEAGAQPGQVQIRIGPRLIQAVMSQYIEPGREVMVEVAETEPRLLLKLFQGGSRPTPVQPGTSQPQPEPPVISARILDLPGNDTVLLRITSPPSSQAGLGPKSPDLSSGRELTAWLQKSASEPALKNGQELRFIVRESFPRLVLQVDSSSQPSRPALAQAVAAFLNHPDQLPQSAAALKSALEFLAGRDVPLAPQSEYSALASMLESLSPSPDKAMEQDPLARLLQLFGLKGGRAELPEKIARFLSRLIAERDTEKTFEQAALKNAGEAAAKLFEALDRVQTLNQQIIRSEQTVMIPFPFFWPGSEGRGEIRLKWPDESSGKDSRPAVRLTFLLLLTRLGRMKIDVTVKEKTIQGAMWVENETARSFLNRNLPRLSESLTARGFKVTDFTARVFPKEQPPPESLAAELEAARNGLISVTV